MFDPNKYRDVANITFSDLATLPEENDRYEFKSSQSKEKGLKEDIIQDASAFWNTGGGLLIVGVDKNRQVDGGIDAEVGTQSRRDWADNIVNQVSPRGPYEISILTPPELAEGKCLLLIGFGESHTGPHMAPDNRYYIRAGAHTHKAGPSIVQGLFARKDVRIPAVRYALRQVEVSTPELSSDGWTTCLRPVAHLQIVVANGIPAYNVKVWFDPVPRASLLFSRYKGGAFGTRMQPFQVDVVTPDIPLSIQLEMPGDDQGQGSQRYFKVGVEYEDPYGKPHLREFSIDLNVQPVQ